MTSSKKSTKPALYTTMRKYNLYTPTTIEKLYREQMDAITFRPSSHHNLIFLMRPRSSLRNPAEPMVLQVEEALGSQEQ